VSKGKIAVGELSEGDTRGAIEYIAEVPQDREVRVLPENYARRD
jgi:hypothetical protein